MKAAKLDNSILSKLERCPWCGDHPLYLKYHDEEWGVPIHEDRYLFEFLILEAAQAGLSWLTILKKREGYRRLFANFDVEKVARYDDEEIAKLLLDPAIVRNRLKVNSTISNAQAFLNLVEKEGSFDEWIWSFVEGSPIQNTFRSMNEVPDKTDLSIKISKELKQRGFRFVGPTIAYAFMQAVGMVNDHLVSCYRWRELNCD